MTSSTVPATVGDNGRRGLSLGRLERDVDRLDAVLRHGRRGSARRPDLGPQRREPGSVRAGGGTVGIAARAAPPTRSEGRRRRPGRSARPCARSSGAMPAVSRTETSDGLAAAAGRPDARLGIRTRRECRRARARSRARSGRRRRPRRARAGPAGGPRAGGGRAGARAAAAPRTRARARRAPRPWSPNSVVCGRDQEHREQRRSRRRRPGARRGRTGIVFGSVIMKKRKTRISGEKTSTRQKCQSSTGPRCQRAVIAWPLAASTARPAANVTQKPIAIPSRWQAQQDREPAGDDDRDGEREPRRHRPPPELERVGQLGAEQEEAEHEAEVRRVEDVAPAELDQVLGQERHGGRPGEDPPAVHAPPVAVLRSGHAQDEGDAVPRQQRARRPQEHVLAPERDPDLEHRSTSAARRESGRSRAGSRTPPARAPASEMITAARWSRGSLSFGSRIGYDEPRIRRVGLPTPIAGALIERSR